MKSFLKPSLAILFAASVFMTTGCGNDDEPTPENEEELITTVRLHATPQGGGNMIMATYKDVDGPGGQAPIVNGLQLAANKVYDVRVEVLDESKTPAEDITQEVKEEADEHQFFYQPSTGLNLTVAYTDQDSKNLPLGITTRMTTAAASTGTLRVILKHQPGTKNNSVNTGETDVEVTFPATIQ
ncbi:hypothetical protein [Nibribacter koreensis]|uniref:Type 1 periplasmic binding fold superfamily protein n=1 Tax=Nibribacter koreensis TaxID=1084519 RepID=A0ABP8FRB9_9BACT